MKIKSLFLMKLFSLLLISNLTFAESKTSISIGYEMSTGKYGLTDDTDIIMVPLSIQKIQDAWRYKVTLPFTSVSGDSTVVASSGMGGGMGGGSITSTQETRSGLGDIAASLSYSMMPKNSKMFYEVSAEVKFGTASAADNLGTGESDYNINLYTLYTKPAVKPYLITGYTFIGDTATVNYNDVFFVTAGLIYQLNAKTVLNMSYDHQQASIDGEEDGKVLRVTLAKKVSQTFSYNFYLSNGLTDTVADSGLGFTIIRNY